jgi:hypothetical protein
MNWHILSERTDSPWQIDQFCADRRGTLQYTQYRTYRRISRPSLALLLPPVSSVCASGRPSAEISAARRPSDGTPIAGRPGGARRAGRHRLSHCEGTRGRVERRREATAVPPTRAARSRGQVAASLIDLHADANRRWSSSSPPHPATTASTTSSRGAEPSARSACQMVDGANRLGPPRDLPERRIAPPDPVPAQGRGGWSTRSGRRATRQTRPRSTARGAPPPPGERLRITVIAPGRHRRAPGHPVPGRPGRPIIGLRPLDLRGGAHRPVPCVWTVRADSAACLLIRHD